MDGAYWPWLANLRSQMLSWVLNIIFVVVVIVIFSLADMSCIHHLPSHTNSLWSYIGLHDTKYAQDSKSADPRHELSSTSFLHQRCSIHAVLWSFYAVLIFKGSLWGSVRISYNMLKASIAFDVPEISKTQQILPMPWSSKLFCNIGPECSTAQPIFKQECDIAASQSLM